jgi:chromate reductase, NAD(P)H dehydrogenase (quinone)
MTRKKKIFAISGSTRKNSTNEKLIQLIGTLLPEQIEYSIYEGTSGLPHFNPDVADQEVAPSVKKFRELIETSDGILICTPEYVFSLPGTLKNALEWTVSTTILLGKPTAFIVASGLGEKTFESLSLILETLGARVGKDMRLLISGARSKFDQHKQLTDAPTLEKIKNLVDAFTETILSDGTGKLPHE